MGPPKPTVWVLLNPMGPDKPNGMGPDDLWETLVRWEMVQLAKDVNLVLVYAPWCGHSKRMLPDYERIKSEYDGKTVNGKKINVLCMILMLIKIKLKNMVLEDSQVFFLEKNGNRESFPS